MAILVSAALEFGAAIAADRNIFSPDEDTPLMREVLLNAIHSDERDGVLTEFSTTGRASGAVEMDLRLVEPDGDNRWSIAKAHIQRDAKGTAESVAGYALDDRHRKRAAAGRCTLQKRLAHQVRVAQLGELSGALAHELQQPLTAILCNAQAGQILIAKDKLDVQELRAILDAIVNDDKHAGQIIQRLRALLMRGETQFQGLEIGCVIDDLLTIARSTLLERNVRVKMRIDEGMPGLRGDRVEIDQVLLNLILNACESMSANPPHDHRIEIVVVQKSDAVCTSVLDCGTGIDGDQTETVFEPFFTTKEGGMGLGLAISHSIIAAHGGDFGLPIERAAEPHFTLRYQS
jgi:C4-dicarboxylate-specific signal transduction histidine kinase